MLQFLPREYSYVDKGTVKFGRSLVPDNTGYTAFAMMGHQKNLLAKCSHLIHVSSC